MISIIIVNYNKSKFLIDALNSIINQSCVKWECIIVDDCSIDNSIEIINKFTILDDRFKLIRNFSNYGASKSRNIGFKSSSYDYIIFLDSDDCLSKNCLFERNEIINTYKYIDFAVFPMGTFLNFIGDSKYVWNNFSGNILNRFLSHDLPWALPSVLWRKSFLEKLNGFNEKFRRLQDVELHVRAVLESKVNFQLFSSYEPDCFYRIDEKRNNFDIYIKNKCDGVISFIDYFSIYLKKRGLNHKRKYLRKTYFRFYSELSYYLKSKRLSKTNFKNYVTKLDNSLEKNMLSNFKTRTLIFIYTKIKTLVNLRGLNYFFYRLI